MKKEEEDEEEDEAKEADDENFEILKKSTLMEHEWEN